MAFGCLSVIQGHLVRVIFMKSITIRQRSVYVGILILAAYAMLTYSISGNKPLGVITDFIAGASVIGIPILMYPLFNSDANRTTNLAYVSARVIEGLLMILGGIFILIPALEGYRNTIYESIHIYFFIAGALFFYVLLYRTRIVPKFISIWGFWATLALLAITVAKLFGIGWPLLNVLIIPMVLNEFFLAFWLMIKGFSPVNESVT